MSSVATSDKPTRKVKKYGISLGVERICRAEKGLIEGRRVGLICNQASVDHTFRHSADLLGSLEGVELRALYGPQHGIRGDVQDNMVDTPHGEDPETGLPVYSL